MIGRIDPGRISPQERAALIYAQARSELSGRLWKAALGDGTQRGSDSISGADRAEMGLDTLIALLGGDRTATAGASQVVPPPPRPSAEDRDDRSDGDGSGSRDRDPAVGGLGANAAYSGTLDAAAERTGLPGPALAAIVQAEAATGPDGRWLAYSRNPRSSAAGLGQFLSGTWISEAERPGTWLHGVAADHGWLDDRGRTRHEARSSLLALRYDGHAAIQAIADYARSNLDGLRSAGVAISDSVEEIARGAYVGHHLGLGDAVRFLKGELPQDRARTLLKAQIGGAAADARIAEAGSATRAHRDWLVGYISRAVAPARFAGNMPVGRHAGLATQA